MIEIKDKNIIISKGDTFNVAFSLEGYELADGDKIIFSIKKNIHSEKPLIVKELSGSSEARDERGDSTDTVQVMIPASEMAALPIGSYIYDLMIISGEARATLNFPAILEVKGVAHYVG